VRRKHFLGSIYLLTHGLSGHSLTTRRDIRGRGTDRPEQEPQTHNTTNIFHLGTRIPDGGLGEDYGEYGKVSDVSIVVDLAQVLIGILDSNVPARIFGA